MKIIFNVAGPYVFSLHLGMSTGLCKNLLWLIGVPARWHWRLADRYVKKDPWNMVNMSTAFDFGLRSRRPREIFEKLLRSFKFWRQNIPTKFKAYNYRFVGKFCLQTLKECLECLFLPLLQYYKFSNQSLAKSTFITFKIKFLT